MRQAAFVLVIFLCTTAAWAGEYQYSLNATGGILYSRGGEVLKFDQGTIFGGGIGFRLGERWNFYADFGKSVLSHKISETGTSPFGAITAATPVDAAFTRLCGTVYRSLRSPDRRLNLSLGLGAGAVIWKYSDPAKDTTYKVKGMRGQTVDFGASELILSAGIRISCRLADRISLQLSTQGDYLTGGGAEFESTVNNARDRWLLSSLLSLNLHFGTVRKRDAWTSDSAWNGSATPRTKTSTPRIDADNDGVPDDIDRCPSTPIGAVTDASGCPLDSDKDGVPDGLDDCPGTPLVARGLVDVDGCPVDADFDGIPDYLDACPHNLVGAVVDATGCPIDSDKDGVPDGLDDCPNSLIGAAVDSRGCLDMGMFAKPMVLHIDYDPGGFEVDLKNKSRLEQLARVLTYVPDLKLEVACYTDDVGSDTDNRVLSERRALRVREYLIIYGVATDRITALGKGETKFVASNQTAEGRAQNRRIEITFHK